MNIFSFQLGQGHLKVKVIFEIFFSFFSLLNKGLQEFIWVIGFFSKNQGLGLYGLRNLDVYLPPYILKLVIRHPALIFFPLEKDVRLLVRSIQMIRLSEIFRTNFVLPFFVQVLDIKDHVRYLNGMLAYLCFSLSSCIHIE